MTWEGGCQCGAVRYRIDAEPEVAYTCHCTLCQQQSSSAFGISVWFPSDKFTLTRGELAFWITSADSGANKICAFCSKCGSRIHHASGDKSPVLSIKGGSLDRISEITPVGHLWVRSALPWASFESDGFPRYQKQPDSFDQMIELYSSWNKS